jgi:hypothetical protein
MLTNTQQITSLLQDIQLAWHLTPRLQNTHIIIISHNQKL